MSNSKFKILVLNGPNLNLLGFREKSIYGDYTLDFINKSILEFSDFYSNFKNIIIELSFYQTNHEGKIIDKLQEAKSLNFDGILLNAGALTHYSYSVSDAISSINIPTIEIHISNIFNRENFRNKSVISRVCRGTITGLGINSYISGLVGLIEILETK